ncbi:non-ribosomal peptide synthetase [Nocardia paucivorans]|uniref:non-ribosomal peptide synthetase n=1 Tax=Nocardia paucivorans TaxID=114259 RepID=UPI000307B4B0|nr:non-ribosomal peptide synthetase [Nocardia paucivorans]
MDSRVGQSCDQNRESGTEAVRSPRSRPTRPARVRRPRVTTLPQLMATAVEANPDGTAVVFADAVDSSGALTYAQLDARSNRLARLLIDRGIGPEDLVAVGVPRSVSSVVAVWAVAKTGAGFVPVDPNYPLERVEHMVTDSHAVVGLTVTEVAAGLPDVVRWITLDDPDTERLLEGYSADPVVFTDRVRPLRAEHPAYVIYTSGSTGKPKGVVVTQAGLAGFCAEQKERYRLDTTTRALHFASPSFDASVLELLLAIGGAGTLVVASPLVYGGDELVALLRRERVTHAFITPAALASLDPTGLDELRVVVAGGEACPPELVRRVVQPISGGTREFYNGYGPTETTIMTNISDPLVPDRMVTIGAPIRGITAYVLDERLVPVPSRVVGELYLTGAQLARGYHDRPGLTAQRFVANPFTGDGSRLYRTGDLVRWTDDGALEYVGRNDFQVKVRGFRIELGEIDAVLAAHDSVDFAVTIGHTLDTGATILAAYVHPAPGHTVDTAALIEHTEQRLPRHMVPTTITVLDTIPLTPVGKLDRAALPAPTLQTTAYRAPQGRLQEAVAEVFTDLLSPTDPVGADDDFFTLGGNSLIATRAAARLGEIVATRVPARLVFEAPTVAGLAARLEQLTGTGERRALTAMERPERIPLSLAQQRMWFLNQFDPASAVNNIPFAVRLSGELDVAALRAAVGDVITRHETLRTVYPAVDGIGYQKILAPDEAMPDVVSEPITESALPEWLAALALTGFDVADQVPLRIGLAELGPDEHIVAMVVHHIAADGASITPFLRDLLTAYLARHAGQAPSWDPLPVQYADYTLWQRELLGDENDPGSVAAKQLEFWRQQLAGLPDRIDLPADRPRPGVSSGAGRIHGFDIDERLHRGIAELAHRTGVSEFMVVHAAFAVLLARLAATDDVTVGIPIAGRGERELDDLVGMFVNTLVLRTPIDPAEPFLDLLGRVKETDLAAFAHAELPFERLVEVLDPVRSQAHHPLFQVALFFQNLDMPQLELPGLSASPLDFDAAIAKFDLQLNIVPRNFADGAPAGLSASFTYATDLFDEATVAEFGQRLIRILDTVIASPTEVVGDIDLLDPAERERILLDRNATDHPVAPGLLLDGYRRTAARLPDALAVVYEGTELTYREFDERVNRLARVLIERGVGAESLVGLALRRSPELVIGMYAIIAAGGAYVPLDPDHPIERITHILDTAEPVCVLTTAADAESLPAGTPILPIDALATDGIPADPVRPDELLRPLRPEHPAYVIFTSGSTGRPKGVAVSHAAIHNQIEWMLAEYPLDELDVYLQKTATTFDVSLWGYFMPLRAGAKLVLATPDGHRDPGYIAEMIATHRVTVTDFVPSMLTVFAAHTAPGSIPTLRDVFVIGEALPPETVAAVRAVSEARIHNLYGPTEAAVSVTYWPAGSQQRSVPIGLPQWNTRVYVLDARLRPVPVGVPGELYLAGDQLARGYVRRPDLTADRFVADPFGSGERMYRTGDLVVWRPDGETGTVVLDYLGRTDFQVKFRGQRIELGEIETALLAQSEVSQAVALVSASSLGDQLVAYVVPAPGHTVDQDELLTAIGKTLPPYMIPAAIVTLDAFPLNPSGKLDRKALPAPTFTAREFRAPTTPVEEIVAEVFAEVLGVSRIGVDDDFFALGGNSLVATRAVARLGTAVGARIPVRTLFEAPTVGALAAAVESETHADRRIPLGSIPRPEQLPLSLAQRRMWFLNQFDQGDDAAAAAGSAAYNLPFALRLSGELDIAALGAALEDVLARHEVLRTVYPETPDGPVQVVLPVGQARLDTAPRRVRTDEVAGEVYALAAMSFDVTEQVPVRVRLLEITDVPAGSAPEYVLAVVVHHIAGDASSMGPLVRDVMVAYGARLTGAEPGWEPLPVQYADYALWQRAVLGDERDPDSVAARQIAYWRAELADLPDVLELPTDRPRPAVASMAGGRVPVVIDAQTHAALLEVARAHNATLFMVVHTAFAVLLARLSGANDIAIGTPVAGRGERELDDLIGMFVNTVVFRSRIDGNEPFDRLLARQRETDLAAFAHADIPFERLVEVLNPPRSTAHHPLFQVGLSFQNVARTALELPGLSVSGVDAELEVSQFDLHLIVGDNYDESGAPTGIGGFITYATDLFDADTVGGFIARLTRILAAVAADGSVPVGDIDILDSAERRTVLADWNDTAFPTVPRGTTLVSLLDHTVATHPYAPALVADLPEGGRVELDYAELDRRVNRLARRLLAAGVRPEVPVALAIRRSVNLVVAMYAVTRAGGAYVPIDPDQPAERTGYILDTARPLCILTDAATGFDTHLAPVLRVDSEEIAQFDDTPIGIAERGAVLRTDHTAYVIFTSGSTGRPKGVAVPHAAVVNQLLWKTAEFDLGPDDAVLLKTPATFDLSVWEFWSAVVCGGRLVIATPEGHRDPEYLGELIARESVTTLHTVPSMLDAVLTASGGRLATSLRRVLAIGEALPGSLAQRFRAVDPGSDPENGAGAQLFNLYGPTEAAVSITSHRVTGNDTNTVPIGRPEWNSRVYVLDARLRPVPVGVPGELYLAGAQLARGYFARPDLTAERFVADPFGTGERLYRTGDLVAWTADGELDYRGRTDFQVKIRGFRIELGDIEAAILALPEIAQTAVVAHTDSRTGNRLVGYLVPVSARDTGADARVDGTDLDIGRVRSALEKALPSYMVPSAFVVLDALPLNVNGKLDRRALPDPEFAPREYRAPAGQTEETIAQVYAEVLGLERVGADDDFFELGGDSIVSIQVVSRARARGIAFSARDVFEARTVAGIARRARSVDVAQELSDTPLIHLSEADMERFRREYPELSQVWPVTPLQQGMLFHALLADTTMDAYTIQYMLDLGGDVDPERLRAAAQGVLDRYENLRVCFAEDGAGNPVQIVQDGVQVPWRRIDLSDVSPDAISPDAVAAELERLRAQDLADHFDMRTAPLLRFALVHTVAADGGSHYRLLVTTHHILVDGWSIPLLMRDLLTLYALDGAAVELPEPPAYRTYLSWLVAHDNGTAPAAWRAALDGVTEPTLVAPVDPGRRITAGTGETGFALSPEATAALAGTAARHGVTVNTVVQAAWGLLLGRSLDRDDVVFGATVSGRPPELPGVESMVGLFVNTLPVRVRLGARDTLDEVLTRLQTQQTELLDHHWLGLADIQHAIGVENLFDSLVVFESFPIDTEGLARAGSVGGMNVNGVASVTGTHYPLTVMVVLGDRLQVSLQYLRDIFDDEQAEALVRRLEMLITRFVETPRARVAEIDVLFDTERAELAAHNDTTVPELLDEATLPVLFDAQVARTPEAVAVRYGETVLTYGELDRRSRTLAAELRRRGVRAETLVAVAMRRGVELVVTVYAVLRAGGAYVPIDPDHPAERSEYVLTGAAPLCVLTTTDTGFHTETGVPVLAVDTLDLPVDPVAGISGRPDDGVWEDDPVRPDNPVRPDDPVRPDNTAYVIYTSGSTGRPKGVAITHRQMVNQFRWAQRTYPHDGSDVVLHKTPTTFDISTWELFWPLQTGASIVIAEPDGHRDPAYLSRVIREYSVTTVHFVPSMLDAFLDPAAAGHEASGDDFGSDGYPSLRRVFAAGEALSAQTADIFAATLPGVELINWYGPAEATVVTAQPAAQRGTGSAVPIGRPVANTRVYVLDRQLRPVPPGVAGELYVAGVQLARGYQYAPALTAERFVAHTDGARLYRTGDIVRWRDGALEYLGRSDFQVKLRGQRIELGEIETVLVDHDSVRHAAVSLVRGDLGDRLVAYVVPVDPVAGIDERRLSEHLRGALPVYMVPSAIVALDAFPLNASGKLDRRALPVPEPTERPYRAPNTPLEYAITEVFAEVLGVERVGLDTDFFELGGNSLLATRVVNRLRARIGAQVRVQWFFTDSTPAELAARILDGRDDADADRALAVLLPLRTRVPEGLAPAAPLFCVHPMFGMAWSYAGVARYLPAEYPIYGLQSPALSEDYLPDALIDMARRYVTEIRSVQPHGPYRLLGWSLGGVIAHAIATELQDAGEEVSLLVMLDSLADIDDTDFRSAVRDALAEIGITIGDEFAGTEFAGEDIHDLGDEALSILRSMIPSDMAALDLERLRCMYRSAMRSTRLINEYRPGVFRGTVHFFSAEEHPMAAGTWERYVDGTVVDHPLPHRHEEMTTPEALAVIGPKLAEWLAEVDGAPDRT